MSSSPPRISGRHGRCGLLASLALLGGVAAGSPAWGAQYGRSTATGDWEDGQWINPSGVIGGTPGATDDVGVGAFFPPMAQQTAAVAVAGAQAAGSVYVGVGSGTSGTLTVESTGSLAANWLQLGSNGGMGHLEVKPGGALTVGQFQVDSSTGGATVNLHGQTMTMEGYIQFGPGTLNRGVGDALSARQFAFFSTNYDFDGVDSFTHGGVVGAGALMSNSAPLNLLEGLQVSSAGAAYVANAPLAMAGNLMVTSGATLDVNADVTSTATGYYWYSTTNLIENATLNLNQGILAAKRLSIAGTSTVNRAGGHYALEWLDLTGTTLTVEAGDSVSHAISLYGGSTLTLEKSIALVAGYAFSLTLDSSTLNLQGHTVEAPTWLLSGASTINRGAGGNIQGKQFAIANGATYDYDGTDVFTEGGSVNGGATMSNSAELALTGNLQVSGSGTTYVADAKITANNIAIQNGGTFEQNSNVFAGGVTLNDGTLNLNQGTLTASSLSIHGASTINRSAGDYSVNSLHISGLNLSYAANDSVAESVSVSGNVALTLEKDLSLSTALSLYGGATLELNGHQASADGFVLYDDRSTIDRGAGGSVAARRASLYNGASFTYEGSDLFSGAVEVRGGSAMTQNTAMTLSDSLTLQENGTTYAANAPLHAGRLWLLGGEITVHETTLAVDNPFGLTIADGSLLKLLFAPTSAPGLNWALRLAGDGAATLQGMLGNQIVASGAPRPVEMIRDVALYGDYTFVGYVAIPEPAAASLLAVGAIAPILGRRRRAKTQAGTRMPS